MSTPHPYSAEERRKRIFAIVGASSGNLVEWFDFYVYAFCAIYFAPAFFPSSNPTTQLLNTAGVFAAGFLMRPIGGWLFGRIADKRGRKTSMVISVTMMCAGSLAIACMPTYASIGALAPALLLLARLFQGLSVGGEYGTTATYMSEVALKGQRGFFSSFQYVTLIGGQLLAVLVVVVLQFLLSEDELIRRIAHLDMDAFFASVELLRYPQLKGLPVVIGGGRRTVDEMLLRALRRPAAGEDPGPEAFPLLKDYVGRGVITTATYPARQFGVGSAMGMMKAAKLCPQAIVLPVDFDEVRRYSRGFKAIIRDIAPLVEDRGVDEVYIDFTEVPGGQREGGRVLARLIQKAIFDATGLTCSIGVAPNKLIAKMASEFNKPNGISIVYEADVQTKIWPLPCARSTASARSPK
jgi:MFS family permease